MADEVAFRKVKQGNCTRAVGADKRAASMSPADQRGRRGRLLRVEEVSPAQQRPVQERRLGDFETAAARGVSQAFSASPRRIGALQQTLRPRRRARGSPTTRSAARRRAAAGSRRRGRGTPCARGGIEDRARVRLRRRFGPCCRTSACRARQAARRCARGTSPGGGGSWRSAWPRLCAPARPRVQQREVPLAGRVRPVAVELQLARAPAQSSPISLTLRQMLSASAAVAGPSRCRSAPRV